MSGKPYISLFVLALSFFLVTCGSTHQADKTPAQSASVSASKSIVTPNTQPKAPVQPVNPFYTGNGGKGISIAILAPKAAGLTENQGYIPSLVQGEFVSNFSGYSALSVMNRENLDNVYGEILSGYYDDSDGAGLDLGRLTATDYLLNGNITRTATGYALQIQITKTADKMTAASYSGTCTFTDLDNLTGIRQVSLDLLQKMGIELTDRAKTELAGAAAANHVNAQTALAQGITAQKNGTVVEALSYYYKAAGFDNSLLEASARASVIATDISSGNIGENVRNDIQRRKEWQKLLTEAEDYFRIHLPYEIVYDPHLTQGKVDYAKETVDLSFNLEVRPTDGFKTVNTILSGLAKTGKVQEWKMERWPLSSSVFVDKIIDGFSRCVKKISVSIQLVNDNGKVIGRSSRDIFCSLGFSNYISGLEAYGSAGWKLPVRDVIRMITSYVATDGWDMSVITKPETENIVFSNVNANDITDNLTVKIISVNGIGAEEAGRTGYIRITSGK